MVNQDHLAHRLFLVLVYRFPKEGKPFFFFCKCFLKLLSNLADVFFTHLLLICKYGFLHCLRRNNLTDCRKQLLWNRAALIFMLVLAALCHDGVDKCNHLLVHLMGSKNRLNHLLFRNFIGSCLNHDNLFLGGRHSQRKVGYLLLGHRWVKHKLTLYQSHLSGGNRPIKRNIRNAGCNGSSQHGRKLW